jgi:hypothetical protein
VTTTAGRAGSARFVSTLWFPLRAQWMSRADVLPPDETWTARRVCQVVRQGLMHDLAVLNGSGRADQLAALLLRLVHPRMRIVLTDCTWQLPQSRLRAAAERLLVRALDGPRTTYCVLSRAEAQQFPLTWGVDPERVRVTHWYHGLRDQDLHAPALPSEGVFAGGDSLRDYGPLLEAAARLDVPVRVAARQLPPADLPPSVSFGEVDEEQYRELMRRARVVVVPLRGGTERSAGQNNYLNPMALGKLVVVTAGTGVDEYVEDGVTGLVVPPGDATALAHALHWALDPTQAARHDSIRRQARATVLERFSPESYVAQLLEVVDDVRRA